MSRSLRPLAVGVACACAFSFAGMAAAVEPQIGVVALGGWTTGRDTRVLGRGRLLTAGLTLDLTRWRGVLFRLEAFPVQVYHEAHRQGVGSDRILATAVDVMARYRFRELGPGLAPFAELGTGPLYAYERPLPRGGSYGNFFDQIGFGLARATRNGGLWSLVARWVHVSNGGFQEPNPGYSFVAVGVGWSLPLRRAHRAP
jgi:Lipid A 3-O-deacylase (PagL)